MAAERAGILAVDVARVDPGEFGQLHDHGTGPARSPVDQNGAGAVDTAPGDTVQHLMRSDARKNHGHNFLGVETGIDFDATVLW